jgi:predicted alpha-1,2-mannosidase
MSAVAVLILVSSCAAQSTARRDKSPLEYANTLVGTAPLDDPKLIGNAPPPGEQLYSGFTSPGARLPHSSTELAPINANLDLSYPAGVRASYFYPNRTIYGFSTGAGDTTIMPIVGDWTVPPERSGSVYDKKQEKASPGYYSVYLDDYRTRVEMTATTWTGIFRFTFPQTEKANILLDLGFSGGDVEVVNDHTVRGKSQNGRAFFIAEFSKPFAAFGTYKQVPSRNGDPIIGFSDVEPEVRSIHGLFAGAYVHYSTTAGEQVLVKVASGVSYEAAQAHLQKEDAGWNFDAVKRAAEEAWLSRLDRVEVKGGTEKERMLFYSCLYHSFASPHLIAKKGEDFTGHDGKILTAEYDRYDTVPFWDTGRNQIVLLTLLEPQTKVDILRSQLDRARESGYMATSFHGDNAIFMYLGDWKRGLNFDWAAAYEYLRKNALDPKGPRGHLAEYMQRGWISDVIPNHNPSPPYAGGKAGAATTLEYSWDDYAMAQYARRLGREDDYQLFLKRAQLPECL